VNPHYKNRFRKWALESVFESIEIIVEPPTTKGNLSDVEVLELATRGIYDDCLVVPCSNIFSSSLTPIVSLFKTTGSTVVALYKAKDVDKARVCSDIDGGVTGKVIEIVGNESHRGSDSARTGICLVPAKTLRRLGDFVSEGLGDGSMSHFIDWLRVVEPVCGCLLQGYCFEIDTLEAYLEAVARTIGGSSIIFYQYNVYKIWTKTEPATQSEGSYWLSKRASASSSSKVKLRVS
jgi:NDP-sugar pyrophosphorylase family protein